MRSTAFEQEHDTAVRLLDLLAKLASEPDVYDATGLIVTEWIDRTTSDEITTAIPGWTPVDVAVTLRHDYVPAELDSARFLHRMVDCVLDRTPVDLHKTARRTRGQPVPE